MAFLDDLGEILSTPMNGALVVAEDIGGKIFDYTGKYAEKIFTKKTETPKE